MRQYYSLCRRFASVACVAFVTGCAGVSEDAVRIGYSDEVYNASNRAVNLQSLLANDPKPLRELLEVWLAGDITALRSRMEPSSLVPLDAKQRTAALRTLVLLAVLNEKYPVERWKPDLELQKALTWALEQDAKLTQDVRARDWSTSLWRAQ